MEKITNKPIDSEKELNEFEEDLVQPNKEESKENINEVEGENLEKKVEQLNSAIADVRKQLEELGQ